MNAATGAASEMKVDDHWREDEERKPENMRLKDDVMNLMHGRRTEVLQ